MHVCNAQTQQCIKHWRPLIKPAWGDLQIPRTVICNPKISNRPAPGPARNSPNGATFEGLPAGPDRRRRFVADRRSMKADVRSLDAMVG